MAENEKSKRPFIRKNPHLRPPPGVQKAMQNFGVRDLREILDKKHQEGESHGEKNEQNKKLPPPDPSYNYLRDPARDKPKPPSSKKEETKKPHDKQRKTEIYQPPRIRDRDNNNMPAKPALKEHQNKVDNASKKELRFSENPKVVEVEPQFSRGGRSSFRGRYPRRGRGGKPREERQGKIENPINIKIEISTETGKRNCILDENTKIPDIRHVPDKTAMTRQSKGPFRGGRGSFRGKGRGRNIYRERVAKTNTNEQSNETEKTDLSENTEENENVNKENTGEETAEENYQEPEELEAENGNENQDEYYDDEQENNEFEDSNENEFSSEYRENETDETSPESERYEEQSRSSFDPNLADTITITSSKYQDGEVKRSVELKVASSESNERESVGCSTAVAKEDIKLGNDGKETTDQ